MLRLSAADEVALEIGRDVLRGARRRAQSFLDRGEPLDSALWHATLFADFATESPADQARLASLVKAYLTSLPPLRLEATRRSTGPLRRASLRERS